MALSNVFTPEELKLVEKKKLTILRKLKKFCKENNLSLGRLAILVPVLYKEETDRKLRKVSNKTR